MSSSHSAAPSLEAILNAAFDAFQRNEGDRAVALYREAIAIDANHGEAWLMLGVIAFHTNHLAQAEQLFTHALTRMPNDTGVRVNLAACLEARGARQEAEQLLQQAIALNPSLVDAHFNLGNNYAAMHRYAEALACYERALQLQPEHPGLRINHAIALKDLGRMDEAAFAFKEVIARDPRNADAYNNLGAIYSEAMLLSDAEKAFRAAIAIDPGKSQSWANLAVVLLQQGKTEEADSCFAHTPKDAVNIAAIESNHLFAMHYDTRATPEQIYEATLRWATRHAPPELANPPAIDDASPHRVLRIGYVSGDFKNHPVGYFIEQTLTLHNRGQFHITCYSNHKKPDDATARMRASSDGWHEVFHLSDDELEQRIRADRIDILVDLSGHIALNRLAVFARKPAPIQVTWLGYINTTGMQAMDYIVADPVLIPLEEEALYVERVERLPETFTHVLPPVMAPEVAPTPALQTGHITFGCFNKLEKTNPPLFALWADLLHAVPQSQLFLKTHALGDAAVRAHVQAQFAALGIAEERLRLEGFSPRAELLAALNAVDIALDTFPYTGSTTTAEALYMGVPVLGRRGFHFVSRTNETMVRAVGDASWLAESEEDFVALGAAKCQDIAALNAERMTRRARFMASTLGDAARHTQQWEAVLRRIWQRKVGTASTI